MFKNVASQKMMVFAFDATTNLPKTGDAANLTAYVAKDNGAVTVLTDTSATEMDATNAKGYYLFDLAQAETNADVLLFSGKSSTSNIVVIGAPAVVYTVAANFGALSIDASGRVDVIKVAGTTQTAGDIIGDTNDIQARLPAALVSGRIDASVGAMAADVVTAAAIADNAIDAGSIATGAITAAKFAAGAIDAAAIADNAIDAGALAANAITAAKIATDAITSAQIATSAATEIAGKVWDEAEASHLVAGTFGNNLQTAEGTIAASLDATVSSRASQASVNTIDDFLDTEVAAILAAVDTEVAAILALLDDARTEPAQGAPPVNPDMATKIDYLYKAWRNKVTQTSTLYQLFADDAATVDQKSTVSDDGTTFTRGEIAAGP